MSAGISIPPELADPDRWQDSRHWLAAQRQRLGLSQREVAQQAGTVQSRISDLENGRTSRPHARTIARYLTALQELAASVEVPAETEAPAAPTRRRGVRENMLRDELKAKALELLGDGQWHNYEAVLRELGRTVPPGLAIRKAEAERIKGRRQRAERKKALPVERQIENGRRALARAALTSGRWMVFETDIPGDPKHRMRQRRIRLVRR